VTNSDIIRSAYGRLLDKSFANLVSAVVAGS
jgi:hypothetical protein